MLILSFGLKNYKGISDLIEIDISNPDNKPFCIVGNNESGKTTILKGIELIGMLLKGNLLQNGKLIDARPKGTYFNNIIEFSVLFQLSKVEIEKIEGRKGKKNGTSLKDKLTETSLIKVIFKYPFKDSKAQESKKELYINNEKIDDNSLSNIFEVIKNHVPEIIYYDEFTFDVPDIVRFLTSQTRQKQPDLANDKTLISDKNKNWQRIFNDLLIGSSNKSENGSAGQFQRDIIDWEQNNDGDSDAVDNRLVAINDYLNKVITKDWEEITGEKSIFDRFQIKRAGNNPDFIDFTLKAEAQGKSFPLNDRSKGCKWFFCFKVLTEIRKHRNSNGIIFLLDEPASNLHIHPQEKILTSLEKLSQGNNQVIYSTHSPFLLKLENENNIFIVNNISSDTDEAPKIICNKLINYDIKNIENEKLIKAIEPILNKFVIDTQGKDWKERIKTLFDKTADLSGKTNAIITLFEKIFKMFPV